MTRVPKVLVTGANGFGGGGLCRYRAGRGVAVRGMYDTPDGGEPDFAHPNIELVPGDLTDGESLERALEGLELVTIRPTAIYGPREHRFLELAKLIASGHSVMFGSGETRYHFIHTDDLSQAFERAAENPNAVGEAYLIGDEHPPTLNEIFQIIGDELGLPAPRYRRRVHWFNSERWFDIGKAKRDLGFRPQVTIEDGLREMVRSFVEAGWLQAPARRRETAEQSR